MKYKLDPLTSRKHWRSLSMPSLSGWSLLFFTLAAVENCISWSRKRLLGTGPRFFCACSRFSRTIALVALLQQPLKSELRQ